MVKQTQTARDIRALTRRVHKLEQQLAQKKQKTNTLLVAKFEAENALLIRELNSERKSGAILRASLKNFSRPYYKIKLAHQKLYEQNKYLRKIAHRARTMNVRLLKGIEQNRTHHLA